MKRYNKEYDFYFNLAKKVEEELGKHLRNSGVRCIVSSRAKSPDRLRVKITERNGERNYKDVDAVFEDIIDLSGVRVAVYFPGNMVDVDKIIRDIFEVEKQKNFPEYRNLPPSPGKYEKVFSGYKATHYRVSMKGETRYSEKHLVEIQVASVLMHAWSEVEHDLVYKPFQGNLSHEEHMILDEINGLVLAGNLALERLQNAGRSRTQDQNYEFKNHYDLTSYFISQESSIMVEGVNFRSLFKILKYFGRTKRSDLDVLNTWIEEKKKELDEIYDGQGNNIPLLNNFYKAMYAIVVVFHEESKNLLSFLAGDIFGGHEFTEEEHVVISSAIRDYFRVNPEFIISYRLSVFYKHIMIDSKSNKSDLLQYSLNTFDIALDGGSETLIEALDEYCELIMKWSPDNFTLQVYNKLVSLNKKINGLIKPT